MASAAGLLSPGLVSLVKRAQNIRQEMDPGFLSSSSENIFQSKSYSNKPKPEDIPQIYDNGKEWAKIRKKRKIVEQRGNAAVC